MSGRWHHHPQSIVYTAETISVVRAELEQGLGWARSTVPDNYKLLKIHMSDEASLLELDVFLRGRVTDLTDLVVSLPPDFGSAIEITRKIGDEWLRSHASVALRVPSVRTAGFNILLNTAHRNMDQIRIVDELDIGRIFLH